MSRIHGTRAILAGTIENASIKNVTITDAKLAQITTAAKVHTSAITGVLGATYGGTGINNGSNTITLGGSVNLAGALTTTGAFDTTFVQQASVTLTLPAVDGTLATEDYVDGIAQSLDIKNSCRAATQAALPAVTYDNGTAGAGATLTADADGVLPDQDGITLVAGDRLLVKNQAAGLQNGLYDVTNVGAVDAPFVLTRVVDADGSPANEVTGGMFTFVEQGTVSGGHGYVLILDGEAVMGTTALVFTQFSGAGQLIQGSGITITGNTVSINATYWDDVQAINTLNMSEAVTYGLVNADLHKLADLDVTAAELNELNGSGCVNADFVKLHNITASAVQLNDVATLSRLAATTNGDGASLIGVEAIANLSATTVQAALAELQGDLDALGTGTLTSLQNEINDTQTGAGLDTDGTYIVNTGGTYINLAESLADADGILDAALNAEVIARGDADDAINTEINAIEAGAGLNTDGTYTPPASNYISTAISLKAAAVALDTKLKAVQDELDATQVGAGLNANGSLTISGSTYMDAASNLKAALVLLDTQVASLSTGAGAVVDYDDLGQGDDSQVLYTVTAGEFVAGSLKVFVNGLLAKMGTEVSETNAAAGTFTFVTAPATDDHIAVSHR